jgi:hypothetical protein
MRKSAFFLLLCLALPALFLTRSASQAQVCEPEDTQKTLQYLRRLSLDLRGYPPSPEEAQEVIQNKSIPDKLIESFVRSPEVLTNLRAYHRDLLWGNLQDLRIVSMDWHLDGDGKDTPLFSRYRSTFYRKHTQEIGCLNEPARIENGQIQTTCQNGESLCQEGYVMIRPYWSPDQDVKVCAFDAQDALKIGNIDCGSNAGLTNTQCGCGPQMRWCQSNAFRTERDILDAMVDQMLALGEDLAKEGKSYTELLTSPYTRINGALSHFWRFQAHTIDGDSRISPDAKINYPEIPFHQKTQWVNVEMPAIYSGILTMPAFLVKFASNRGRATRFYQSFLCTDFQAPPDGLPPGQDACHQEPNLMKRCGCNFCHQALEPAAAHWGRFLENGYALLDAEKYPKRLDKCNKPGQVDSFCRQHYLTNPTTDSEEEFRGYLRAYVFADKAMEQNIEGGPRGIALQAIQGGKFSTCTARKLWSWFAGTPYPTEERVKALGEQFAQSQYKLLDLLKAIVTSPEYKQGSFYKP